MSRREDLERLIRESYGIIRVHKETIQTSDRPEEKLRSQRAVDAQWVLIEGYLEAYLPLVGDALPPDIAEIAAHFPSMPGQRPRPAPTPLEDEPGRAPGVQQKARIRQRTQEAQASWDMLSKRIAALRRDLVLELDGETKIVLQERLDVLEQERRAVEAELERLTRLRRGGIA